jgi:hypothetical protein
VIVLNNLFGPVDGTSCAAPVRLFPLFLLSWHHPQSFGKQSIAGVISLLNDFLITNGKKPLGFLNPWLYGDASSLGGFNDIVHGTNPGCETLGFSAIAGWDPVRPQDLTLFIFEVY